MTPKVRKARKNSAEKIYEDAAGGEVMEVTGGVKLSAEMPTAELEVISLSGKTVANLTLALSVTIKQVKHHIESECGVSTFCQRLVNKMNAPEDDATTLAELQAPLTLTLVVLPYDTDVQTCGRLVDAAARGSACEVETLLQQCAWPDCVDRGGYTPMMWSACRGHSEVTRLLLVAKADKDKAKSDGATPLHMACVNGHLKLLSDLCDAGCDLQKPTLNGATPLHMASLGGHASIARFLCKRGVDKDIAAKNGVTPLISAAFHGHANVVRFLCEQGADKTKRANNGATPLVAAFHNGHSTCCKILRRFGASMFPTEYQSINAGFHGGMNTPYCTGQSYMELDESQKFHTHRLLQGLASVATKYPGATAANNYGISQSNLHDMVDAFLLDVQLAMPRDENAKLEINADALQHILACLHSIRPSTDKVLGIPHVSRRPS
jgi:hypothetical protein